MPHRRGVVLLEAMAGVMYLGWLGLHALQLAVTSGIDVAGLVSILGFAPLILLLVVGQRAMATKQGQQEGQSTAQALLVAQLTQRTMDGAEKYGGLLERTQRSQVDVLELRREIDTLRKEEGEKRHAVATKALQQFAELELRLRQVEQQNTRRESDRRQPEERG